MLKEINLRYSLFFLLIILASCQQMNAPETGAIQEENQVFPLFDLDTILEKNTPKALDLTRHQLFIDTTRNSSFYEGLMNWQPQEFALHSIQEYIKNLEETSKSIKVNFKNFPRHFVQINRWENDFYLYDRCDGIDPRYELTDSALIHYGPLESYAETFVQLKQINNQMIKLNLLTQETAHTTGLVQFEITKSKYDNIYKLKHQFGNHRSESFVIPVTEIPYYNLIVNHSPNRKVREFAPFFSTASQ